MDWLSLWIDQPFRGSRLLICHVLPEPWKCVGSGGACIDHSGGALGNAIRIRGYAKRGDAIIYVDMHIYQSRRHDHSSRIQDLARLRFGDVGCHARNFALADGNVSFGGEVLGWIDHAASADQKIVGRRAASLRLEQGDGLLIQLARQRGQQNGATQESSTILERHEY